MDLLPGRPMRKAVKMLLIVEKQEMNQEISVNELEKQLNKDGFLTYYINFDTGKAIIKPESEKSIDQIAEGCTCAQGEHRRSHR